MTRLMITVDDYIGRMVQRVADKRNTSSEEAASYLLERTLSDIPRHSIIAKDDYKPQRIPVMLDSTADRVKKQFRCQSCGAIVFYYYGSVKLIAYGQYDSSTNMIDGEDIEWFDKIGVPTEIVCPGRMIVQLPDGRQSRVSCSTVYYRIGA